MPTCNYLAVHAHGRVRRLEGEADTEKTLRYLVATYEPANRTQWDPLPEQCTGGLLRAIVAFETALADVQGEKSEARIAPPPGASTATNWRYAVGGMLLPFSVIVEACTLDWYTD